jgi:2-dehydropantoate 2-reductase
MKILVMGSGGVGGFYGGRLANSGCDVTFVARGAHLAALRDHGLLIESEAQGNIHVKSVNVTDNPASAGTPDLVIIAVKLWDTAAVAKSIKPIVGPNTAVLSLQNGVVKDDILRGVFGDRAVMGGVAYVGTHIARPGVINQVGTLQRLVFGEYDGKKSARVEALLAALLKAGIQAEISDDIRRTLWEKYTFLVGLSGATASMRTTIGPVRENAQTRAFMHDLMKETVAVGRQRARHHGFVAAPRSEKRQPARSRMARRRRGATRQESGCGDAVQPRGVGHPRTTRGRALAKRVISCCMTCDAGEFAYAEARVIDVD